MLVGNGLSIAFNSDLILASITREMILRMRSSSDNGDQVVHAMKEIASRSVSLEDVTDGDFEKLVGAFDSQAVTLEELGRLAELVETDDEHLRHSIQEVAKFSQRVRDRGISYVLEVVTERSRADHELHAKIHSTIQSIIDTFTGRITFGNLNYDTLLLSALLAIDAPLADMGRGWDSVNITVVDTDNPNLPGTTYPAQTLRRTLDFPAGDRYRVRLLHLHGSLTFWGEVGGSRHIKVPIESVRAHDMWSGLRDGEPKWRPDVVLANQRDKARHIEKYPFSLGYTGFGVSLVDSDHWLIIGYSFRDKCINDVLRAEFLKRRIKPSVLVSTFGDLPSRDEIEEAFGWGAEDAESRWLYVNREGIVGLENTWEWALFTYEQQS